MVLGFGQDMVLELADRKMYVSSLDYNFLTVGKKYHHEDTFCAVHPYLPKQHCAR